jgi:signal recognition particle subunit SRP54
VVIIDTAGRLAIDKELMKQAQDIKNAVSPNEVLFVIDSMTGQDAAKTTKAFNDSVNITGVVLSKLDADTRGGAALSVVSTSKRPILFASTGEKLDDLQEFHPDRMANRILDMGDILTLIEQAEQKLDSEESQKLADKIISGESFNLNDFLEQINQIAKLGSLKSIMKMVPGLSQYKNSIENFDEQELVRIKSIIMSMTPFERANPSKINGSRKQRIASGSGTSVTKVNSMLANFTKMQKSMKGMINNGGDFTNLAGGSIDSFTRQRNKKGKKKKKGKKGLSGNPAKRAMQEKEMTMKMLKNKVD